MRQIGQGASDVLQRETRATFPKPTYLPAARRNSVSAVGTISYCQVSRVMPKDWYGFPQKYMIDKRPFEGTVFYLPQSPRN
jgi:hypothetical protein